MTLRHLLYWWGERRFHLSQQLYSSGQFAQMASVSVRTLRYYDKVGLLSPSQHTGAGFRLYSDEDLFNLQQILALKFLGFSLDEIKICLQTQPERLRATLSTQKAMMREKRAQLDAVIQAIEQAEHVLQTDQADWDSIVHVIQVMQMEQNKEWVNKYFTPEQVEKMNELSRNAYTDEDKQKLAEWGKNWSEEDQKVANAQWGAVNAEIKRLVAEGKHPADPEAQAWAQQYTALLAQFTRNDPGIQAGLNRYWQSFNELPAEQQPMPAPYSEAETAFIVETVKIYRQK